MNLQETATALFGPVSLSDPCNSINFTLYLIKPYGAVDVTSVARSSEVPDTAGVSVFILLVQSNTGINRGVSGRFNILNL